ncbi:hypothetical protein D7Y27_37435, partial [Corallococcus sp. AB004]
MMRDDGWRRSLGGLLLGIAVAWSAGCKKEQPQASAPVDAGVARVAVVDAGMPDAGPVAKVARPLRFSNVVIARDKPYVRVTYTLTNPGTAQGRGASRGKQAQGLAGRSEGAAVTGVLGGREQQ